MSNWIQEELEEKFSQSLVLLKKIKDTPEDSALRSVVESFIDEHRSYLQDEPKGGYDISELDGDKLPF